MNGSEYIMLVGDARAFSETAWLVETEIRRLGASPDHTSPIGGGTKGWPSRTVWESLKTASHFNLGVALELRLKCLLKLKGIQWPSGKDGHMLAKLCDLLPPEIAKRLADLFLESTGDSGIALLAFIHSSTPTPPKRPANRPLNTLQEFFEYMDGDMALWEKRYSWERVSTQVWRHYLDDLRPFLDFVGKVEKLGADLARKAGVIC